jgi:hypothetical protein
VSMVMKSSFSGRGPVRLEPGIRSGRHFFGP